MEKTVKRSKTILFLILLLRIVIGGIFIFSGFVKAIDPWGTIYKFQEYFLVLDFTSLLPLVTFLAFFLASFEFVFGVFIVFGCYRRVAPLMLILSMVFMLPLTLYLALTNNVKDCGCFGDAIYISNWATFIKNIFITAGLVFLFRYNKRVKNIYGIAVQWIVGFFSLAFVISICSIGYFYQPLLDFRPFKVGTSLVDKNRSVENEPTYKFIYKKGTEQKEFTVDNLPGDDWEFVDRIEISPKKKINEADKLVISEQGEDITNEVIKQDGEQIILLFPNLDDVEISYTFVINEIYDLALMHGVGVVGLTSASNQEIDQWKDLSMAAYPLYMIDDSILKQIARGNPAIIYLKDGIIQWKSALRSIPMADFNKDASDMSLIANTFDAKRNLYSLVLLYISSMCILLAINRTHKVFKLKSYLSKKNKNKDVTLHSQK